MGLPQWLGGGAPGLPRSASRAVQAVEAGQAPFPMVPGFTCPREHGVPGFVLRIQRSHPP